MNKPESDIEIAAQCGVELRLPVLKTDLAAWQKAENEAMYNQNSFLNKYRKEVHNAKRK
jgi:hypothetical protein